MSFRSGAFILLIVAVALTTAEPPRYRLHSSRLQQRRPFFARQESAPSEPQPNAALYPAADELKPENPFQGEEEVSQPELVYGPPDSIYGPPLPETDPLPAVEEAPEFAPEPEAEEFSSIQISRPSRLQQRPRRVQQRTQLHLVQRTQRLQQRRQQQRATIRQVANVPQQKASIKQVVNTQRLVARPRPAAALVVAAPSAAIVPSISPSKVVISSERLVAVESPPTFNAAAIDVPFGESYVVVNSPFALSSQYQQW